MHVVCTNILGANVLKPRFKIDVVIMIICSIVIIINSVLTLQVSTAKKSRESEHHFWGFPQVILSWSQSVPNNSVQCTHLTM
jgi:hypothetical protein